MKQKENYIKYSEFKISIFINKTSHKIAEKFNYDNFSIVKQK